MAIEKGLYQTPEGIEDFEQDMTQMGEMNGADAMVGIDVVTEGDLPVMVELEDGSVEISFGEEVDETLETAPFDANLAEYLEDGQLREIASDLVGYVESDIASRKEWADTYVRGLEVVGFNYEERVEPWENACGVYSNVLAEAAIPVPSGGYERDVPCCWALLRPKS